MLFLPLFHVFGHNAIMNTAFAAERALCCSGASTLSKRLRPSSEQVTMLYAVPTIYITLLNMAWSLACWSRAVFFSAAATCRLEIANRWRARYGSANYRVMDYSESSPFATYNHVWKHGQALSDAHRERRIESRLC